MQYIGDLVDIGLNVDLSGLRQKLEQQDSRIDSLREDLGGKADGLDEDRVHDLIANYVSDNDLVDNQEVSRLVQNELSNYSDSDDVDQKIEDALEDYFGTADFEQKVRDMAHDEGVLTEDNLEGSTPFSDLAQKVEDLDSAADVRMDALAERQDTLEGKVELLQSSEALVQRVEGLEQQIKAQDSAVDGLERRIKDLEAELLDIRENNTTALTFFDLIKQAFALLQRGS